MKKKSNEILKAAVRAHNKGDLETAQTLYKSVLKLMPKQPDANHNLGILYASTGDIKNALDCFKSSLESNPKEGQYWISYIDALIKCNHPVEASQLLSQGKKSGLQGTKVDQLERRISQAFYSNDGTIEKELTALLEFFNQGKLGEAVKIGLKLLKNFPLNSLVLNLLGATLSASGQLAKAIEKLKKSIILRPAYAEAYNNLGAAVHDSKNSKRAIFIYKKSIVIKPNYIDATNNLGVALSVIGKHEEAVINFKNAIKIDPSTVESYNNLGNALTQLKKYKAAIGCYNKAIENNPIFHRGYTNLGTTFYKMGQSKKAIKFLKKAIKVEPNWFEARFHLAHIFKDLGNYSEAISYYDSINTPGSNGHILECLYRSGNYDGFNKKIYQIAKSDNTNIRTASISAFVNNQLKQKDLYNFCKNPLDFLYVGNLDAHTRSVDDFIASVISEVDKVEMEWEPLNKSTHRGFQTRPTIFQSGENCKTLQNHLEQELQSYFLNFESSASLLIRGWPKKINIEGWFVRLKQNGYQEAHIHPSGWLSGVVYLKTVEPSGSNEGAIEFGLHGFDLPVLDKNHPTRTHQPQKGDIVLFPSSLFHKTIPFEEDTERCVIAFDLKPHQGK
ncbi:tetratricopeptide repeat protein [Rhodospirillaceae bacterium]|nr:tetratricopeptide repeat protein [Rhodospirillaceae bacterium]